MDFLKKDIQVIKRICDAIEKHYGVTTREFAALGCKHKMVRPRRAAMYLIYELTSLTYEQIGELCGGRHISTTCTACTTVKELLGADDTDNEFINHMIETIKI